MLVVPYGQDQPDNARRAVERGVGLTVSRKKYTRATVEPVLRSLLTDSSYARRASEVAAFVHAEHGTTTACDAIEGILERHV
jgi:UDP:flavonoid glycosyltransferase YjiC (YdhE family)